VDPRQWTIPESEPISSKVARIAPHSFSSGQNVTFLIEKGSLGGEDLSQYFIVDSRNRVLLAKALNGKVRNYNTFILSHSHGNGKKLMLQIIQKGSHGSLYVVANGTDIFSTKSEVRVVIVGDDENHGNNQRQNFGPPYSSIPQGIPPQFFPSSSPRTTTSTAQPPVATSPTAATTSSSTTTPPLTTPQTHNLTSPQQEQPTTTTAPAESESSSDSSLTLTITTLVLLVALTLTLAAYLILRFRKKKPPTQVVKKTSANASSSNSSIAQWVGKRAHSNRYEDCESNSLQANNVSPGNQNDPSKVSIRLKILLKLKNQVTMETNFKKHSKKL
jgi:hypothetical protein